ncbi:MAG: TldD/PmbA family protein [Candidatus Odinarchaeota archaeon]
MDMEDILVMADKAIKRISESQCEGEIYFEHSYNETITLERGQLKIANLADLIGYSIRVKKNNRFSFSSSSNLDEFNGIIDLAIDSLSISQPDEFQNFSWPATDKTPVYEYYDKNVETTTSESMIEDLLAMNSFSQDVKHLESFGGTWSKRKLGRVIFNTNGVELNDMQTSMYVSASCNLKKDNTTAYGFEFQHDHKRVTVDTERIAKTAIEVSKSQLEKETIESGSWPVIIHPLCVNEFLGWLLPPALAGDQILRNNSPFIDKIGDQIASEVFTVYDDPKVSVQRNSSFDDEGTVRETPLPVIEKGILQGYIHNNRSAKAMGTESTGNGFHWERYNGHSYGYAVSVYPTTFKIHLGSETWETMLEDINYGLLLGYVIGAHSSVIANGNYSVVAYMANIIENGQLGCAPKRAMLPGNLTETLTRVIQVSKEHREDFNDWNYSISSPYLLIDGMKIIS